LVIAGIGSWAGIVGWDHGLCHLAWRGYFAFRKNDVIYDAISSYFISGSFIGLYKREALTIGLESR